MSQQLDYNYVTNLFSYKMERADELKRPLGIFLAWLLRFLMFSPAYLILAGIPIRMFWSDIARFYCMTMLIDFWLKTKYLTNLMVIFWGFDSSNSFFHRNNYKIEKNKFRFRKVFSSK